MSQEILSLGNSVPATGFPQEIMSPLIFEQSMYFQDILSLPALGASDLLSTKLAGIYMNS